MEVRTRFAPSPTGLLHIGNVRTALITYLAAKKYNGKFILRIDDTDFERSLPEYVEMIKKDLAWLGFAWDELHHQSERFDRYSEIKQQLLATGRLYPCYETQEELELKRKIQLNMGKPPIYDRAALKLSEAEKNEYQEKGVKPHYRFRLEHEEIKWHDLIRGETKFHGSNLSDPIVIREDGSYTYLLCSVVDDIDMAITHVVRGEDHVTNTAINIQILEALGAKIPQFAHLTLLKMAEKISKRTGGADIKSLRAKSYSPMAILSLLSKLGTSDPMKLCYNFEEIVADFSFDKFGRSLVTYSEEDLAKLNQKYIHHSEYERILPELTRLELNHIP